MRGWLAVFTGIALLLPATAGAIGSPAECARLQRQLKHYRTMGMRAESAGNAMWTEKLRVHVELLQAQQLERCPEDVPVDTTGEAFKALLRLAAQAAIAYFTFGAYGAVF